MQQSGSQVFKTVLTIVGIMLLVVFGARAASQASSLAAVGGTPKHFANPVSSFGQLAALSGDTLGTTKMHTPALQTSAASANNSTQTVGKANEVKQLKANIAAAQVAKRAEKKVAAGLETVALSLSNDQTVTAQPAAPKQHVK